VTEGLRTRPNPYNTYQCRLTWFPESCLPLFAITVKSLGSISHRDEKLTKSRAWILQKSGNVSHFSRLINYLSFCEPRCNFDSAFRLTSRCTSTERTSQIISKTVGMENQMTSACDFTSPFLLSEHRDGVGRSTGTREAESEMGKKKR
jgi:hypothetical protein